MGGLWVGASRSSEIAGLALHLLGADEKNGGLAQHGPGKRRDGDGRNMEHSTAEVPGSLVTLEYRVGYRVGDLTCSAG